MPTCPACGLEVPEGSRFCGHCGHEIAPVIESESKDLADRVSRIIKEDPAEEVPQAVPVEVYKEDTRILKAIGEDETQPPSGANNSKNKGVKTAIFIGLGLVAVALIAILAFAHPSNNANPPNSQSMQTSGSSAASSVPGTITLSTFNDRKNNGIVVAVPSQWAKAPITGGDYGGWKFINPSDPNEEEILVNCGDVGSCINPDGSLDPSRVIPETNVTGSFTFNHGLSVGYTFYQAGNPYEGNGVVTVSTDENGYGYVEVILPAEEKPLATQILNSFQLTL
jgi:hypothetical protein